MPPVPPEQPEPEQIVAWVPPPEADRVEAWRLQVLIDAGYPMYLAELIAIDHHIDLHEAVELIRHGCAYRTAADILL